MPPAKPHAASPVPPRRTSTGPALEVVDPRWLVRALGLCVVGALICAYATLCLLFYQGRWQFVLHPSRIVDRTPANAGLAYSDVRFDAAQTGLPRLTAWWLPATAQAAFAPRFAAFTILYLHDGSGSLSDTVPMLARLHSAGINVFAIDYRGFGDSDASVHPSQQRMAEDAAAALEYLTQTRHISPGNIIPYGTGLAASLAAHLADSRPDLPAVILDNPDPDPAATAFAARPTHLVPVRLLFGDQFDARVPLATVAAPKLLIAGGPNSATGAADLKQWQPLFKSARSLSTTVTLPRTQADQAYRIALTNFLDQLLTSSYPPAANSKRSNHATKE